MSDGWTVVDTQTKKQQKAKERKEQKKIEREEQERIQALELAQRDQLYNQLLGRPTQAIKVREESEIDVYLREKEEERIKALEKEKEKEKLKAAKIRAREAEKKAARTVAIKPKITLSDAAQKISLQKVQQQVSALEEQYPGHRDVQLKGLAEYFEGALGDIDRSVFQPNAKNFAAQIAAPLDHIKPDIISYLKSLLSKLSKPELKQFGFFLYETLFPLSHENVLVTSGTGVRVLFQLVVASYLQVVESVTAPLVKNPPTLSQIPTLSWVLAQALPHSPSLALKFWYQFLFPLLIEEEETNRRTHEREIAQGYAAEFIAHILENYADNLKVHQVGSELLQRATEQLYQAKQQKKYPTS